MVFAILGFLLGCVSVVFFVLLIISLFTKKNRKRNAIICASSWVVAFILIIIGALTSPSTADDHSTSASSSPAPSSSPAATPTPSATTTSSATATPSATVATNSAETIGKHIYDSAEVFDLMNGTGDKKVGEYSIIRTDSSNVTEDSLFDWYMNYVSKNNHSFDLIAYTDKEALGCSANTNSTLIEKDIPLIQGKNKNDLSTGSSVNATLYGINDERTGLYIVAAPSNIDQEHIIEVINEIIPDEYKDKYIDPIIIDAYQEKNKLVFYLVNDSFTSVETCQTVTEKIIAEISAKDFYPQIGIAEFTFQAQYNVTCMITIDDLQAADINNLRASMDVLDRS